MKDRLVERFIRYVKVNTQSCEENADKGIIPSFEGEWDLAGILLNELQSLGFEDCVVTKNCYVYGILKATEGMENREGFCLLAHMDTSPEVSGQNVEPIVENGRIHTDGSTLLGADDKAGAAEIVTALEYVVENKISHPDIEVVFSPDEETGHGMDKVPLELIKSKSAYTVDGGAFGELESECFNAAKAEVKFRGKACHTGYARGIMVNAALMASAFVAGLPRNQMPETTDRKLGFYAPLEISGNLEASTVYLLLRDFEKEGLEERKKYVRQLAELTVVSFGGSVEVSIEDQYVNMREKLEENPVVVERLVKAYKAAGVEPEYVPIRGGTDGSRLTELGIPCPNIFTGGYNFHSRTEYAVIDEMVSACNVLIELIKG